MMVSRSSEPQLRECRLVALERLPTDGFLERRLSRFEAHVVQTDHRRRAALPAEFVAQAVEHRLPEVRLQRADAPRLEVLHLSERPQEGVLDEIIGIGEVAGPPREPSAYPTAKRRKMPRHQSFERLAVAAANALDQRECRLEERRGGITPIEVFVRHTQLVCTAELLGAF